MKCMIEEMRLKKGITQAELSRRTKISQPRISEYESGKRIPTMVNLFKMSEAMGCSIADIMEWR